MDWAGSARPCSALGRNYVNFCACELRDGFDKLQLNPCVIVKAKKVIRALALRIRHVGQLWLHAALGSHTHTYHTNRIRGI